MDEGSKIEMRKIDMLLFNPNLDDPVLRAIFESEIRWTSDK